MTFLSSAVVKQAMMQTQDPDIQAKLIAMQKQMQQKELAPAKEKKNPEHDQLMAAKQQQLKLAQARTKLSQEEKEDAARFVDKRIMID